MAALQGGVEGFEEMPRRKKGEKERGKERARRERESRGEWENEGRE